MTKQKIIDAAVAVLESMRTEFVPYDTGNMALHALSYEINNNVIDIKIDPAIAPYVPYTNEPWLSPKWHGKQNPNEGWWQRFAEEFIRRFTTAIKGELR